jgi:hypothetical protein
MEPVLPGSQYRETVENDDGGEMKRQQNKGWEAFVMTIRVNQAALVRINPALCQSDASLDALRSGKWVI